MAEYVVGMQAKALMRSAEDMLEPLIGSDEESSSSDDSSGDDSSDDDDSSTSSAASIEHKPTKSQRLKMAAVYLGLGIGSVTSVAAMVLYQAAAVIVGAGLCIINIPYAAYKEHKIVKIPALRSLNNKLREDANQLEANVDALGEEIDILVPEAERASQLQEQLSDICGEQKVNVDKLVDLVKENQEILNKMKENLRQRIAQDVMRIVITSDKDNNGTFSKLETRMLVFKIRMELQAYDVDFDEKKFLLIMGENSSVQRVIDIVTRLIPDPATHNCDDADSDNEENELYDLFHMGSNNSISRSIVGGPVGEEPSPSEGQKLSLSVCGQKSRRAVPPERLSQSQAAAAVVARRKSSTVGGVAAASSLEPTEGASKRRRKRDVLKEKLHEGTHRLGRHTFLEGQATGRHPLAGKRNSRQQSM